MTAERNIYINGDIDLALERGYDVVQPKFDGWWCKVVCKAHITEFYSETGRLFGTAEVSLPGCIFIGEFMRGTQWAQHPDRKGKVFLYDIWAAFDEPVTEETYRQRWSLLRKLQLPNYFQVVPNHSSKDFDNIWDYYVEQNGFEGVVFRRSIGKLGDAIIRKKKTVTLDGPVIGFVEGQGKHAGRLGAVTVMLPDGKTVRVGGGFTDDQRIDIWNNQMNYLNRIAEVEGYAVFESGSIRHPNFIRWRDDKISIPSESPL